MNNSFHLIALIFLPLLGALVIAAAPARNAFRIALLTTFLCVLQFLLIAWRFEFSSLAVPGAADAAALDQFVSSALWFEPLGLKFSLGLDTVSLLLIALTVLLGPICVAASKSAISQRVKTYYAWLLILQTAMTGVFAARDLALFYVFFEFTLVPMFVLISLFGSDNRKHAAVKFFLYTFTGSIFTLAGLAYVALVHHSKTGEWSFAFNALAGTAREMSASQQAWIFFALMAGFAIKVPIFPLHTWLPLAHTEAPTAGSVVLAGVLLKLGTYGIYRFALSMTPVAAYDYAPFLGVLAVLGIVVAGLICWIQQDIKKLVAYSSVSHLGFCVLGLFALNGVGLSGSILYMVNHGLSTGALFLLIGMIYERHHTRDFRKLGGLASHMPLWAFFIVFFTMASVGLPGLNGFISEFMCLLGAFQSSSLHWTGPDPAAFPGATPGPLGPYFAFFAGLGLVITAMYLLYMLGNIVWGAFKAPGHDHANHHAAHSHEHAHSTLSRDLNAREIALLTPLALACLYLGLYPSPLLRAIEPEVANVVALIREANTPDTHNAIVPVQPADTPASPAAHAQETH